MGKIYTENGWLIRVQGNEHPPVHVHVLHPDGKALITLDGDIKNSGVVTNSIENYSYGLLNASTQIAQTAYAI